MPRITTGIMAANSWPRVALCSGEAVLIRFQKKIVRSSISGTMTMLKNTVRILLSISGASQSPARKPITTEGMAAIISTTGLTRPFSFGDMNWLV